MTSSQRWFQSFWLIALLAIAVVEIVSIVRPEAADTLSEYTRSKTAHLPMRLFLGAMLGWLTFHWLFAQNGRSHNPLLDYSAAAIGALLGFMAFVMQAVPR